MSDDDQIDIGHRGIIWITDLGADRAFEVRTAEGLAKEYGADSNEVVAANLKDRRPLAEAFGSEVGYHAALAIQKSKGREVSFGDVLMIEGRKYQVRHRSGGHPWDEVELVPNADEQ